jgi:hypothetical protein
LTDLGLWDCESMVILEKIRDGRGIPPVGAESVCKSVRRKGLREILRCSVIAGNGCKRKKQKKIGGILSAEAGAERDSGGAQGGLEGVEARIHNK